MNRKKTQTINGYFLSKIPGQECDDNDDSDDSEVEDALDFRDINVISDGGVQIKAKALKRQTINFQEYGGGRVHSIAGSFPIVDPWWAAKISVSQHSMKRKILHGVPSYSIRCDSDVYMSIPLLLKACQVDESYIELFVHHLRGFQEYENLNFETLPSLLDKVGQISQSHYQIMQTISWMLTNGPGKLVQSCLSNPDIYQYLPQLFPKSFHSLMMLEDKRILYSLQEALDKDPWVFGYSNVMSYRYNLFGLEAPRQAYIDSGLITRLTEVQADALHIYTALKMLSRRYGHTYVCDTGLPSYHMLKDPEVKHWKEAFEFLERNKVIVMEVDCAAQLIKIYLWKNWKAEKSIAEHFKTILDRHQSDPWTYDIDFQSEQFSDFLKDADQQQAVELIASQPLVCLSGKGGCGKTHVVSRTFQHAERLIQEEEMKTMKRAQEEMFNESDGLDDYTLTQTVSELEKSYLPEYSTKALADHSSDHLTKDNWDKSLMSDCQKAEKAECDEKSAEKMFCNGDLTSEVVLSQRSTLMEGSRFIDDYELEFYQEKPGQSNDKPAEKNFPTVLLTAPTGKAANLLGKRAGLPSNTLHQLLTLGTTTYARVLQHVVEAWVGTGALVVDECSLVSVQTFSTMLSMLMEEASLRKLVLLGDVNQLPSIEPGNFLADTYQSLERIGCSIMLTTNHRTGAQLIVHNASLISQRQMPIVDSSQHFHLYSITEPVAGVTPNTAQDDITCDQDALVRKMLASETSLSMPKESQFVAFRRRDCDAINEICCKHYCQHTTRDNKNHRWFQTGDKICCSKNATVRDEISGNNIRLCNGEIFFISKDIEVQENGGKTNRYLELQDEDSSVKVDFRVLRKSCKIRHAWARTIHTYQGSEAGTVVYVVGSPNNQTWQHVYTAVTRGKKQVYILTRQSYLQTAVLNTPRRRYTSLKDRLTKMIAKLPAHAFPRKMNLTLVVSPFKNMSHSPKCKGNNRSLLFKSPASNQEKKLNNVTSTSSTQPQQKTQTNSHGDRANKKMLIPPSDSKRKLFSKKSDSQSFSDWEDDLELSVLDDLVELYDAGDDGNDKISAESCEEVEQMKPTHSKEYEVKPKSIFGGNLKHSASTGLEKKAVDEQHGQPKNCTAMKGILCDNKEVIDGDEKLHGVHRTKSHVDDVLEFHSIEPKVVKPNPEASREIFEGVEQWNQCSDTKLAIVAESVHQTKDCVDKLRDSHSYEAEVINPKQQVSGQHAGNMGHFNHWNDTARSTLAEWPSEGDSDSDLAASCDYVMSHHQVNCNTEENPLFDIRDTTIEEYRQTKRQDHTQCVRKLENSFGASSGTNNCSRSSLFDMPVSVTIKKDSETNEIPTTTCVPCISVDRSKSKDNLPEFQKPKQSTSDIHMFQGQRTDRDMHANRHNNYKSEESLNLFDDSFPDESWHLIDMTSEYDGKVKVTPKRNRELEDILTSPKKVMLQEGSSTGTVNVSPLRNMIQRTTLGSPESN